jgi:hypothetical protein
MSFLILWAQMGLAPDVTPILCMILFVVSLLCLFMSFNPKKFNVFCKNNVFNALNQSI